MPVPSLITDISTTAASNSPAGSDPIGGTLDDYLRNIQAIVKKQFVKGTDLASAATLPVPVEGAYFVVTGSTTITALANCYDGRTVTLYFPAGITLTHSSALVLPGAGNIVTQAGDCGTFVNDGTSIWRCVNYSNGAPGLLTGRNRLINGNFDIWQSYTGAVTATTSYQYAADQLRFKTGSGTATFSRNTHTVANAAYGTYYGTFALASNGVSELSQPIENVRTLAGQTVTFSFYANISTGSAQTVTAFATQVFGTGGSPSGSVTTSSNVTVNNTGFARYTVTLAIPSISGKTVGTNGDDYLSIGVTLPNGTYTIDTFGWQAEAGGVATPFEFRPLGLELALCQRYYEAGNIYGLAYASSGAALQRTVVHFKASKRVAPTCAFAYVAGTSQTPIAVLTYTDLIVVNWPSFTSAGDNTSATYTASSRF